MPTGPSPYKGHPKSEWPAIKAAQEVLRKQRATVGQPEPDQRPMQSPAAAPANAFAPPEVAAVLAGDVPLEIPVPRVNSDSAGPEALPRNLFSGQIKALDVFGLNGDTTDPLTGYRLYWFTDIGGTGNRLHQAKASGWDFVRKDEIAMQDNLVPGNNDLGTMVRKVVNPNETPPTYGYLMKKPKWMDEVHQAEMQQVNDAQERAIKKGAFNARPQDGRYVAGDIPNSALPKIEISSNLKVPR